MPASSHFTVASLAARTAKTVRRAVVPLTQIVGGGQALIILLSVLFMGPSPFEMNFQAHPVGYSLWGLCLIPLSVIIMTAVLLALKTARGGKTPHWKPVLKTAAFRLWPVLGALTLMLAGIWIVLFILGVAAVLLLAAVYAFSPEMTVIVALPLGAGAVFLFAAVLTYATFAVYAVALEDVPVLSSFQYACRLIKGRFWGTLGLNLAAWLAVTALALAVALVQLMITPLYLLGDWLGAAVTWCLSVPFAVLNTSVTLGAGSEIYADRQNRAKINAETQTPR